MRRSVAAVAIAAALAAGCADSGRPGALAVAAASDLRFAMEEVAREFQSKARIEVAVSYGASGNLYGQLVNRAPFDVYLSADLEYPRRLAAAGMGEAGSEFTYATGRLAVWTPAGSAVHVSGMSALEDSAVKRIAIANPEHAPYGRAAEAALRGAGIYERVRAKLVFGENVAQALQFAESGNAEVALVGVSLASAAGGRGRYWELPQQLYPRIVQGGLILKWARDRAAAQAFREFLLSASGRAILTRHGFGEP